MPGCRLGECGVMEGEVEEVSVVEGGSEGDGGVT